MSLESFSKELNNLMTLEGISKRSLALQTGLQRKSIINWISGRFYPRYDALLVLAKYFKVSTDFLLGIDSEDNLGRVNDVKPENLQPVFKQRLNSLMNLNNMTAYRLSKEIKIGQSTITKWTRYDSMPEVDALIKLSQVFNVAVDYLLGIIDLRLFMLCNVGNYTIWMKKQMIGLANLLH